MRRAHAQGLVVAARFVNVNCHAECKPQNSTAYLKKVVQPIELVASLDDRAASVEMQGLLQEIASLSSRITVIERRGDDERKPSFRINHIGTDIGVRWRNMNVPGKIELRADAVLQWKLNGLPNVSVITNAQTTEVVGDGSKAQGLIYKKSRDSGGAHAAARRRVCADGFVAEYGLVEGHGCAVEARRNYGRFAWPHQRARRVRGGRRLEGSTERV